MLKRTIILFGACLLATLSTFAQAKVLTILHTNDTHSQIEPYTYKTDTNVGGFLRREAFIREKRAASPDLLLLDAGDFSQGTPYFNFFKGYMEIRLMNAMHYDAVALGNHEFDNGSAALAKRLRKADFPALCANYLFHNRKLAKTVKPFAIFHRGGLTVGVFGLTADLQELVSPETAAELTYLDPIAAAKQMVDTLNRQHCDLIVCLSHLGIGEGTVNDFTVAESVPGIDLIIGGHTHKFLAEPVVVNGTRIYQLANKGKCVGEISIEY